MVTTWQNSNNEKHLMSQQTTLSLLTAHLGRYASTTGFQIQHFIVRINFKPWAHGEKTYASLCSFVHFATKAPFLFCFLLIYMYTVSVNKEIKGLEGVFAPGVFWGHNMAFLCQAPEYIHRKISVHCPFSVIALSNLNSDHVRLYDVDPLYFPANRGSYRSSAVVCSDSYRLALTALADSRLSDSLGGGKKNQLITFQKSPEPCLY